MHLHSFSWLRFKKTRTANSKLAHSTIELPGTPEISTTAQMFFAHENKLSNLPPEIVLLISQFSVEEFHERNQLALVCQKFNKVANNDDLWHHLYCCQFVKTTNSFLCKAKSTPQKEDKTYKTWCRERLEAQRTGLFILPFS